MKNKLRSRIAVLFGGLALLGCSPPDVTFFSQAFLSEISGSLFPIAPGPQPGYVMVYVQNSTAQSVEFVVTAEAEEIIAQLDGVGNVTGSETRPLEPQTVNLFTDVTAPTLAIVFDNSPVDFPPVGPNELTFEDVQSAVNQLESDDPESVQDRDFIRLVRVLEIGLGPDLELPPDQDEGIVVRPPGSDPDQTAGTILPSGASKALSYDIGGDLADFGNGDMIIFLATTSANAVGGIQVVAGLVDGEAANAGGSFVRETFEILRDIEGPISPPPPD